MNIAIIGCGRIALAHIQALQNVPSFRLVALCDVDENAARNLAQHCDESVRTETDVARLISDVALDAAIVCTPPVTHPQVVTELLSNGVNVLCEKPLAISLESALAMHEIAAKHQRHLQFASKFRFVEDVQRAQEILESAAIGEVQGFNINFCAPVEMRGRWNAEPALSGGGVVMDNGPHAFDIARLLFGELQCVCAILCDAGQQLPVEDEAQIEVKTRGGVSGTVGLSWSRKSESDYFIEIGGTRGALEIGWKYSRLKQNGDWQIFGEGYDKDAAFGNQLEHFAAQINQSKAPQISREDALAAVRAVEAAYESAREKRWTEI